MGISLDQYRATIGNWAAGRMKKILPAPEPLKLIKEQQEPNYSPHIGGPWKLHAVTLSFLFLMLVCHFCMALHGYHSPGTNTLTCASRTPDNWDLTDSRMDSNPNGVRMLAGYDLMEKTSPEQAIALGNRVATR